MRTYHFNSYGFNLTIYNDVICVIFIILFTRILEFRRKENITLNIFSSFNPIRKCNAYLTTNIIIRTWRYMRFCNDCSSIFSKNIKVPLCCITWKLHLIWQCNIEIVTFFQVCSISTRIPIH